ncbi:unnamed protein product [Allacma fusca]|uniref:Uncharacterized protein n=1 Tax=Allacma fusca TaxID=39272 RepID=A0A8J2NY59_9HEXA|nr:unnamed protein product [Allacma fusca]
MQEIALSYFATIRSSEASFKALGAVSGLNATQIVVTFIRSLICCLQINHKKDLFDKSFTSSENTSTLTKKLRGRDNLYVAIVSTLLPGPAVIAAVFVFSFLHPEFPLLFSSAISLPGYLNYVIVLLSSISCTCAGLAVIGNSAIWGYAFVTYVVTVDETLNYLINNSSHLSYMAFLKLYQKIKILEIHENYAFSFIVLVAQVFFMQEIVLASFISIRSSETTIKIVKMITGLNAVQNMLILMKGSAALHDKSAELLSSKTKSYRRAPRISRIQRSLRPLYIRFGGLYYADKGLTFAVLDITLNQTIDLLLAN